MATKKEKKARLNARRERKEGRKKERKKERGKGKGREGKGREGKGRAGQGRAGQGIYLPLVSCLLSLPEGRRAFGSRLDAAARRRGGALWARAPPEGRAAYF